jgi:hypothetical protein
MHTLWGLGDRSVRARIAAKAGKRWPSNDEVVGETDNGDGVPPVALGLASGLLFEHGQSARARRFRGTTESVVAAGKPS